jgi:hypothetical protein
VTVHPFIGAEKQGGHNVKRACEPPQVSRAAFYARRTTVPGPPAGASTSPASPRSRAGSAWPPSSTSPRGASWAGPPPTTRAPSSSPMLCGPPAGPVIFHPDRGGQYTSRELAHPAGTLDVRLSVGRTGQCWNNALAESFFATLKAGVRPRGGGPRRRSGWFRRRGPRAERSRLIPAREVWASAGRAVPGSVAAGSSG